MRKVLSSHSEVCHVFAQRSQDEGRSGNIFFDDIDKIYSYGRHYLLARFYDNGSFVVVNDSGYSVSTSKHISLVSSAVSHHERFYLSGIVFKMVDYQIEALNKKLARARKPEIYIRDIIGLCNSFLRFQEYLKENAAEKKSNYIFDSDTRLRATTKEINKIKKILNSVDSDNYKEALQKEAEREKRRQLKEYRQLCEKFINGESVRIHSSFGDIIRLSGDKVETSKGVFIDRAKCDVMLQALEQGKDITGRKLDYYTINSVKGDKIVIGCHTLSLKQVKEVLTVK